MNKLIATTIAAVSIATGVAVATPAEARPYPGCYYSYRGCYLPGGWYDGRWWGGGSWWGWSGAPRPVIGCPVPYETGLCG